MSAIRLNWGKLYADILHDTRDGEDRWIYIVQRVGWPDILAMGACTTREAADRVAEETMAEIDRGSAAQAAS